MNALLCSAACLLFCLDLKTGLAPRHPQAHDNTQPTKAQANTASGVEGKKIKLRLALSAAVKVKGTTTMPRLLLLPPAKTHFLSPFPAFPPPPPPPRALGVRMYAAVAGRGSAGEEAAAAAAAASGTTARGRRLVKVREERRRREYDREHTYPGWAR